MVNNSEETNQFFEEFTGEIRSRQYGKEFYIDSSKVEQVTVDALIYLIAILQNNQLNISMNYKFRGNYPENEEARKVYFESGFNDFVASNMKRLPKSSDRFKIVCGETTAPETTGECCQFVMETLGKSRVEIMHLQSVFVELMSNVVCHAYEKNKFMAKKWYIYGEHIDDYVRFIFVDTGLGIAKTVRKNNFEKMRDFFGIGVTDSDLIRSVFEGKFRTATSERHRGNGLVSVRKYVSTGPFEGLQVLSGRGRCIIIPNREDSLSDELICHNYNKPLFGTLYEFIVR